MMQTQVLIEIFNPAKSQSQELNKIINRARDQSPQTQQKPIIESNANDFWSPLKEKFF